MIFLKLLYVLLAITSTIVHSPTYAMLDECHDRFCPDHHSHRPRNQDNPFGYLPELDDVKQIHVGDISPMLAAQDRYRLEKQEREAEKKAREEKKAQRVAEQKARAKAERERRKAHAQAIREQREARAQAEREELEARVRAERKKFREEAQARAQAELERREAQARERAAQQASEEAYYRELPDDVAMNIPSPNPRTTSACSSSSDCSSPFNMLRVSPLARFRDQRSSVGTLTIIPETSVPMTLVTPPSDQQEGPDLNDLRCTETFDNGEDDKDGANNTEVQAEEEKVQQKEKEEESLVIDLTIPCAGCKKACQARNKREFLQHKANKTLLCIQCNKKTSWKTCSDCDHKIFIRPDQRHTVYGVKKWTCSMITWKVVDLEAREHVAACKETQLEKAKAAELSA